MVSEIQFPTCVLYVCHTCSSACTPMSMNADMSTYESVSPTHGLALEFLGECIDMWACENQEDLWLLWV